MWNAVLILIAGLSAVWLAVLLIQDAGDLVLDGGRADTNIERESRKARLRVLWPLLVNGLSLVGFGALSVLIARKIRVAWPRPRRASHRRLSAPATLHAISAQSPGAAAT